jgi:8-oxo-dGTP pyrophosphatase MutT (NUDIX family)
VSAVPVPRDAASVIVARDVAGGGIEVYMLRRSASSKAFPDAWVFPGGTVDSDDRAPEAQALLAGTWRPDDHAMTVAAIRETFEECGLLFADSPVTSSRLHAARIALHAGTNSFAQLVGELGVRLDAAALHYFARRVTPSHNPYRFDARFFVARLPDGQVPEADAFETHDGAWFDPGAISDAALRNEIHVLRPTLRWLGEVRRFRDVDALLAFADAQPRVLGDADGER